MKHTRACQERCAITFTVLEQTDFQDDTEYATN